MVGICSRTWPADEPQLYPKGLLQSAIYTDTNLALHAQLDAAPLH